jgi:TetR/AcrR family transcriptional repressor of nem operon
MGRKSDARNRLIATAHEMIWRYSYGAVSIDKICEQAGVKKGSFYYFFESKSDLTLATLTAWWSEFRPLAHEMFRPEIPPLERISNYFDYVVERQLKAYDKSGQVLGCPLFTLASEICTQDAQLNALLLEILNHLAKLFEEAIAQAQANGELEGSDPALKTRLLWAFYEGTLTRARIQNDPELLRSLSSDARKLVTGLPLTSKAKPHQWKSSLRQKAGRSPVLSLRGKGKTGKIKTIFAELALMSKYAEEMIVLTDAQGRVKWVNAAFVRTCGYTLQELRGKTPGSVLQGPKSHPQAVDQIRQAVHAARPCECQMINYKKDGSTYPVHISLGPIFSEGKLGGFLAVENDLSAKEA